MSNPFLINKNTILEANWVLKKIKITYDAMSGNFEDGSYQKVIYVEQNSPFEYLEIPTNGSRLFNGWYVMKRVIMLKKVQFLLKI